jgi:hypothetical protein
MVEWYLWDGARQIGPIERTALERHLLHHPEPSQLKIWREGWSDWQSVDALIMVSQKNPLDPSTFARPHKSVAKSKYQNFIARNWRGEYPLWVAYWIVGLFSNIFAVVVAEAVGFFSSGAYNPIGILAFLLLLWAFIAALSLWQWVGIWRSAQRQITERATLGRRAPWAGLAKVLVCLSILQFVGLVISRAIPQLSEAANIAFLDDPGLPAYSIRVMNNGTEAEIAGGIKFGLAREFETVLKASNRIHVVHLDSPGGRIGEAAKVNALIRQKGLDTYVESKCLSACTLVFVAGRQRILKKGARLGFHRGSFAGEDQVDDHSGGIERTLFKTAGILSTFVDRALATKNTDMWYPTEQELKDAGVTTQISNGGNFALGGFGVTHISRGDWDSILQKVSPVYSALREKYPKTYNEVLDAIYGGVDKGTPQAQLFAETRSKVHAFIKTLLPNADDAVLVNFGRLATEQYRAILAQDATVCFRFASGENGGDAVQLIPSELQQRELQLDAQIIMTARKRLTAKNNDHLWDKIRTQMMQRGYDVSKLQILSEKNVKPSDYARYCEATITLYQEITNLPSSEAASILRELLS